MNLWLVHLIYRNVRVKRYHSLLYMLKRPFVFPHEKMNFNYSVSKTSLLLHAYDRFHDNRIWYRLNMKKIFKLSLTNNCSYEDDYELWKYFYMPYDITTIWMVIFYYIQCQKPFLLFLAANVHNHITHCIICEPPYSYFDIIFIKFMPKRQLRPTQLLDFT